MRIDHNPYVPSYSNGGPKKAGSAEQSAPAKKTDESTSKALPTNEEAVTVNLSKGARLLSKAMSLLNQEEAPRDEAVKRGQAIIEEWQGATDTQIDAMFERLFDSETI
tara:strand:+ start:430 stop:753 length:324 start_codon:yes stop_codon:yes gene_type:complete